MKPREFYEWVDHYQRAFKGIINLDFAKLVWDAARDGMIPADQAIKVPPVEEWPEWASGISVEYTRNTLPVKTPGGIEIHYIPRPTPAVPKWTPKIGDRVFVMTSFDFSGVVGIGIIVPALSGGPDTFFVRLSTGDESSISPYGIRYLKPFDASKIGKRWEDI